MYSLSKFIELSSCNYYTICLNCRVSTTYLIRNISFVDRLLVTHMTPQQKIQGAMGSIYRTLRLTYSNLSCPGPTRGDQNKQHKGQAWLVRGGDRAS